MEVKRRPFQGVLNILDFNRHFYFYGIAAFIIILVIVIYLQLPSLVSILVIGGFVYGLAAPLVVSAYVYDFSNYYSLDWLDTFVNKVTGTMHLVNINAGFDETSFIIKSKFPESKINVYDFYDKEHHTEPAIVRARKVSSVYPNTRSISTNSIPEADDSIDIVFLLSSAHEIRDFQEKVRFLKECRRMCKPEGKIIMVEHLRDIPNFLAFTIGFNHFFSKNVWEDAFMQAGFKNLEEKKFTPFMSIFECKA